MQLFSWQYWKKEAESWKGTYERELAFRVEIEKKVADLKKEISTLRQEGVVKKYEVVCGDVTTTVSADNVVDSVRMPYLPSVEELVSYIDHAQRQLFYRPDNYSESNEKQRLVTFFRSNAVVGVFLNPTVYITKG